MKKNPSKIALGLLLVFILSGIIYFFTNKKSEETTESPTEKIAAPNFNADSSYQFVAKQVEFGPRVPNSSAHAAFRAYLIQKLKEYGMQPIVQEFEVSYRGKMTKGYNIISQFNPTIGKRILLAAHYDSRPVAEKDSKNPNSPIDGADDGASGVGVLLEIARTLKTSQNPPAVGVDFIFFDLEDGGEPNTGDGWILGSEYWSTHKMPENYQAFYGILLDMVGAKDAQFPLEAISANYAPFVQKMIWNTASELGYSNYFIPKEGGGITDDHLPVIQKANIQMIDIIHLKSGFDFPSHHHTHQDNLSVIDKNTLKAVGQTLLQVLYQE